MVFQPPRFKAAQWLLALLAAVMLSACGFHLRGQANLPFKTIYVDLPISSPLGRDLRRYLHVNGVEVVDHQEQAETVFQVLADRKEQKILTLNTSGQVSEYSLFEHLTFQLKDNKGVVIVAPTTITQHRDMTYDANFALAKQSEQELLYRDMQSEMVQQIIRRLSSSKPGAGNVPVDEE